MCSVKIIFFAFRSSDIRLFLVYKTTCFFYHSCFLKSIFVAIFLVMVALEISEWMKGIQFARKYLFFLRGLFFLARLHKLAEKHLNHFRKLMLLFLSRMFHYVMKRGFLLGNCVFIAVITILWKSASRVSIWHDHYKLGCLLYKIN